MVVDQRHELYRLGWLVGVAGHQRGPSDGCAHGHDDLYADLHRRRRKRDAKCDCDGDGSGDRVGHLDVERAHHEYRWHAGHHADRLSHLLRHLDGRADSVDCGERSYHHDLHGHGAYVGYMVLRGSRRRVGWNGERTEPHRLENILSNGALRDYL